MNKKLIKTLKRNKLIKSDAEYIVQNETEFWNEDNLVSLKELREAREYNQEEYKYLIKAIYDIDPNFF